jgi:hypothetical protein
MGLNEELVNDPAWWVRELEHETRLEQGVGYCELADSFSNIGRDYLSISHDDRSFLNMSRFSLGQPCLGEISWGGSGFHGVSGLSEMDLVESRDTVACHCWGQCSFLRARLVLSEIFGHRVQSSMNMIRSDSW